MSDIITNNSAYGYIYKITINKDNKQFFYFGQRLVARDLLDFRYIYCGSGRIIKDYVRSKGYCINRLTEKHLIDLNITKEILEYCYTNQEDLNKLEAKYVNCHLGEKTCWNLIEGGGQGQPTDKMREILSKAHIGLKWSEKRRKAENRRKELQLPHGNKGKIRTLEQRKHISDGHKGLPGKNKGIHFSEKIKSKLSKIRLNSKKVNKYINITCKEWNETFTNLYDLKQKHPEINTGSLNYSLRHSCFYNNLHWTFKINPLFKKRKINNGKSTN